MNSGNKLKRKPLNSFFLIRKNGDYKSKIIKNNANNIGEKMRISSRKVTLFPEEINNSWKAIKEYNY